MHRALRESLYTLSSFSGFIHKQCCLVSAVEETKNRHRMYHWPQSARDSGLDSD